MLRRPLQRPQQKRRKPKHRNKPQPRQPRHVPQRHHRVGLSFRRRAHALFTAPQYALRRLRQLPAPALVHRLQDNVPVAACLSVDSRSFSGLVRNHPEERLAVLVRRLCPDNVVRCTPREPRQPAAVRPWVDRVRSALAQVARQFQGVRVRVRQDRHDVQGSATFRAA